ncbi:MAG: ABC transporter ATP-binding protein, partial [Anaerolineaceae bacterium]|nr:ABC transporter ATP-binding protein [Anaerolineaceae bacterium]
MNILYGLYHPDEGEILVNGNITAIKSPIDAIKAGIGMVHQHFMLVPVFTVTENVMLGEEFTKYGGVLDRAKAAQKVQEISDKYNLNIDPNAYIKDMPVGLQQRVEIIKLLFREANILIMDEPTAVLTPQEVIELFKIMQTLIDQGKSIIFITHKLGEVLESANKITVIRGGKVVGSTDPKTATMNELANMMVGREVSLEVDKEIQKTGEIVLEVRDLKVLDPRGGVAVDEINFEVRAGEVLGIAGVQGNGQTELVRSLTGLLTAIDGTILLSGQDITHSNPRQITELGTAHIPEDRQKDGLVLGLPISDNLVLNTYYLKPYSKGIWLDQKVIIETGENLVKSFDIRTPSVFTPASSLSGGNQQKIIVAR